MPNSPVRALSLEQPALLELTQYQPYHDIRGEVLWKLQPPFDIYKSELVFFSARSTIVLATLVARRVTILSVHE